MEIATQAVRIGLEWDTRTGAVTVPIYQTATFRHPGLGQSTGYDYSRSGNPTRQALEEGIARLDGGARGFAYASGMAAITSLLLLFKPGDHLVVTEDLYGGTYRLFDKIFSQYGLTFTYVDTSDPAPCPGGDPRHHQGAVRRVAHQPAAQVRRPPGPRRPLPRTERPLHRRQHLPDPLPAAAAGPGRRHRRLQRQQVSGRAQRHDLRDCRRQRSGAGEAGLLPPERRRRRAGAAGLLADDPRHEDARRPPRPAAGERRARSPTGLAGTRG